MEVTIACRVCLAVDIKMAEIQFPLDVFFEQITGINPLMTELPPFLCYLCALHVRKYYLFREQCLRGQSTLYNILETDGQITKQNLVLVDKQNFLLPSNLEINIITEDTIINCEHEDPSKQDIKFEVSEDEAKSEILPIEDIKQEDNGDDFPSQCSSDDEPLSVHKNNKEIEVEKVPKKRGRKKKNEKAEIKGLSDLEELEKLILPRRRGRPIKLLDSGPVVRERRTKNTGGVDTMEEPDLEDFVNIITLTIEEQMEEISKRQQSQNYLASPFQCKLCFKGFIDTDAYNHHVKKHDPSAGDVECPVCKARFKTKRVFLKHATQHEKKYACKSCNYVSKTPTQAKQHHRWHKGVTYKCQYCDEVSTKWTSYLSHVRIKHPSEFICSMCGYSFVSKLGLSMHKTMMHKDLLQKEKEEPEETADGPYCQQCDVRFISQEAYKRHMVTSVKHIQSSDFKNGCKVCGEMFKTSEELRLHHRKEHARKRPKNYGKKRSINITFPSKCEFCPEDIPSAREYWNHFRRCHPDKNYPIARNYVCDICGKSYRGNAFLVYHKRTHFEERAYQCQQCPKAFFNRTNLQMHEKTHSEDRPYPCSVCFKAFKCKGALNRHFRSHTGVKPYECEVCGKAFNQSNSRKLHVRTVHLKQPAPYISRTRMERRKVGQVVVKPLDSNVPPVWPM